MLRLQLVTFGVAGLSLLCTLLTSFSLLAAVACYCIVVAVKAPTAAWDDHSRLDLGIGGVTWMCHGDIMSPLGIHVYNCH